MSQESDKLHDLVKVINTGNELYEHVRQRIDDADLTAFCDANLSDRRKVLDKLQGAVVARTGAAEEGADLESRLEQHRAELRVLLESNDEYVYMDHLEDLEEKTQQAYQEALSVAESAGLRSLLEDLELDFRRIYDRVRSAQQRSGGRERPRTLPTRLMR